MSKDEWFKCTKCNTPLEPVHEPEIQDLEDETYYTQIDDGERIIFHGRYGMFYDDIDYQIKDAFLCHDCMVELLEWFPESFRKQFKGAHPFSHKANGRCCKYAWDFEDDEEK